MPRRVRIDYVRERQAQYYPFPFPDALEMHPRSCPPIKSHRRSQRDVDSNTTILTIKSLEQVKVVSGSGDLVAVQIKQGDDRC